MHQMANFWNSGGDFTVEMFKNIDVFTANHFDYCLSKVKMIHSKLDSVMNCVLKFKDNLDKKPANQKDRNA